MPRDLTPEELAEVQAVEAAEFSPLRDLSADDLASLAVEDKTFNIADEFQQRPELHADQPTVQKIADAHNKVKQRGFSMSDLPSVPEAAKTVGTTVLGLGKQLWNYANVAGNVAAGAVAEVVGAEGYAKGYGEEIDRRLASNIAGTEEAMTGLAEMGEKVIKKGARAVGISKGLEEYTPAERVTDLFDAAGKSQTRQERLTGKGEFTKAVTGGGRKLDPEEIQTLAAGDPFSFYAFGRGAAALSQGVRAVTPAAVQRAVATGTRAVGQAAETAAPMVVGKGLTAAAITAKGTAKAVEKTAPIVGPILGGIKGGAVTIAGADLGGAGIAGGIYLGRRAGKTVAAGAARAAEPLEKVADIGRQISGSVPIKSAYAQGARDVLQALPGAAGEVAKGTALDIGLAAASAETPQDTAGAIGFGTAIGVLGGARRVAGRAISGQLIAPREYGVNEIVPSSKQFSGLDTMHTDAMQRATPGVRARLNAVRQFAEGATPGTDVFLAGDAVAAERALIETGISPDTAKQWAAQEGLFTTSLPGKDGSNRRIVIVRNVEAAPHEAFHAVQDVIGEAGNLQIDRLVREAYAAEWESEGAKYAQRLGGDAANWRETVLDATGLGDLEAKEKVYRDIANRIEAETGATPSPKLVEEMAKAELGRRLDEALERNPDVDPNEISQRVWRDILTPEDITRAADKYIAREIAAENFDAIFKNQGLRLEEGKQLPQRLARIVGGLVSALGGDPLAGRTSEFSQVALKAPVVEAVRALATPEIPVVRRTEPASARRPKIAVEPAKPVEVAAAVEARTIADEAPTGIPIGGTKSPRELLGTIAESIANQEGVKINYLSAPDEPAAAISSNRDIRRAVIELNRDSPPARRKLWEKNFVPDKVIKTKNGKYQIQGLAPEVFASNAHKMAKFMSEVPDAGLLSPYPIDPQTKTFTEAGWQQLFDAAQTVSHNHARGYTGTGEQLVVPRSVTEAGGYAPQVKGDPKPLPQAEADFVNLLLNFRLPDTPRMTAGKRPLNIQGQEISAATKPGRIRKPVQAREKFSGPEAESQNIAGREILEVNPLRNQLEQAAQSAGVAMPSLIEAIQRLNLERIKEVVGTPEQPALRANTLTASAGFQPDIGRPVREWRITGQLRGQTQEITVPAIDMAAARKEAQSRGMRVSKIEASDKFTNAMFQPKLTATETAALVENFSPDEFRAWAATQPLGFTRTAWDVGLAAPDRAFADSLKARADEFGDQVENARVNLRTGDMATMIQRLEDMQILAMQTQFFTEAHEAAVGIGSAVKRLLEENPNYVPPFPQMTP